VHYRLRRAMLPSAAGSWCGTTEILRASCPERRIFGQWVCLPCAPSRHLEVTLCKRVVLADRIQAPGSAPAAQRLAITASQAFTENTTIVVLSGCGDGGADALYLAKRWERRSSWKILRLRTGLHANAAIARSAWTRSGLQSMAREIAAINGKETT